MKIERKALEVLRAIAKKVADDQKYSITLSHDWGLGTATVQIAGLGHTHVGDDSGDADECLASFVGELYSLLVEGRGLSLVWAPSQSYSTRPQ